MSSLDRIGAALDAGELILKDPYLPHVSYLIVDIYKNTPPSKDKFGVTETRSVLKGMVPILQGYNYTLKHPLSKWLGLAAIIGIPLMLGYALGRRG